MFIPKDGSTHTHRRQKLWKIYLCVCVCVWSVAVAGASC
ncbi:hypothetical protein, unlikely [Trypanosoma brucei brucei TREU927]|uniref:Uncharacterized protein n=1 Tax=Trypanosoma brucei brucei (strain 927/4 GUTat10.1) TaxID=185431 RepID=Q38DZ3_TRYB2|nr:hypothetical protein, unlikely [Trypanosoma brucei brucei TREU927]EAN76977.1 hypothetical protein, unlikely [Trypanosoma brucei brucei TREU927]